MLSAPLRAAIAGAVHGALEWLPVSSSGHVALLVDRAGWPEADAANPRALRTLEVALHTGSIVPIGLRVLGDLRTAESPARVAAAGLGATAVTSVLGATIGPVIEARFSGPRAVAAGLIGGSAALVWSERAAAGRAGTVDGTSAPAGRQLESLTPTDALVVGLAQSAALWPGTSRRAATLAAARARGLDPAAADALSWVAGLPTLAGATVWQGYRDRAALADAAPTVAAGVVASAGVGLATRSLPPRTRRWSAAVWASWRLALAAATLRRP